MPTTITGTSISLTSEVSTLSMVPASVVAKVWFELQLNGKI